MIEKHSGGFWYDFDSRFLQNHLHFLPDFCCQSHSCCLVLFLLTQNKEKCRLLAFGILVTLSFLLANFSVIVFHAASPAAFLDCRQGNEELQECFPLPAGCLWKASFTSRGQQHPSHWSSTSAALQKDREHSKPTLCSVGCLVCGKAKGKIKTHPLSFCTWSHVLCRCFQER